MFCWPYFGWPEWRLQFTQFVQKASECPNIAGERELIVNECFWCHIRWRAHCFSLLRCQQLFEVIILTEKQKDEKRNRIDFYWLMDIGQFHLHIDDSGHAEIGQFESTIGSNQNIVRFDVFVNHIFHVQIFNADQHVDEQTNGVLQMRIEEYHKLSLLFVIVTTISTPHFHLHFHWEMIYDLFSPANISITDHCMHIPWRCTHDSWCRNVARIWWCADVSNSAANRFLVEPGHAMHCANGSHAFFWCNKSNYPCEDIYTRFCDLIEARRRMIIWIRNVNLWMVYPNDPVPNSSIIEYPSWFIFSSRKLKI